MTIVVASYYALFAVMGESAAALGRESTVILLFVLAAGVGFKRSLWVVAVALCAHGVFDFHAGLIENPGVPGWWPPFCGAYDVTAGAYLAVLLSRSKAASPPAPTHRAVP